MRRCIIAVIAALDWRAPAAAQSFPDRLVRMIVPFPPGGPVDVTARIVGQPLGPILGQPLVIENRGGASGAIGAKLVAAAEPDGYTLLRQHQLAGGDAGRQPQPRLRSRQGLRAGGQADAEFPGAGGASRFPGEVGARARRLCQGQSRQAQLQLPGPGNASHLAAELFKLKTGTDIVHVPYKGAAEAATGVMAGQVQMFFGDIGGKLPLIREGRLRALALSAETRSPEMPELPTMIESGGRTGCVADLPSAWWRPPAPARHRRQAQRRDQQGAAGAGGRRGRGAAQRRRSSGVGGGFWRLPRQGAGQVAGGGSGFLASRCNRNRYCPARSLVKIAAAAPRTADGKPSGRQP